MKISIKQNHYNDLVKIIEKWNTLVETDNGLVLLPSFADIVDDIIFCLGFDDSISEKRKISLSLDNEDYKEICDIIKLAYEGIDCEDGRLVCFSPGECVISEILSWLDIEVKTNERNT